MSLKTNNLYVVTGGVFPEHMRKVVRLVARSEIWADCWRTSPVLTFYGEEIVWKREHLSPLLRVESVATECEVATLTEVA